MIISMSAAFLNLLAIVILNKVYAWIALKLTNLENPRTQTDFEDNYTFKIFFFQFINFYSSLIYVAFFKGKFFQNPNEKLEGIHNFKSDLCDPAGCLYELSFQLAIIMVGKQFLNNFIEILLPKLTTFWKRYVYRKNTVENGGEDTTVYTRWEQDYNLQGVESLSLIEEYLEMAIQYGFITLFVAAFPLAPFFALVNNVIEIRVDAYKYVTTLRRPLAQRVQDIGAWANILQTLTYISIFTNAMVIAVTSDFIPRLVFQYIVSEDNSWEGYVNWTLSSMNASEWAESSVASRALAFNTSDWGNRDELSGEYLGPSKTILNDSALNGIEVCYFKGFRDDNGDGEYPLNINFFQVWIARLAFILIFQNTIMGLTGLFAVLVPDVPFSVKTQILRENLLAREAIYETDINNDKVIGIGEPNKNAEIVIQAENTDAIKDQELRNRAVEEDLDSIEGSIREYF